MRHVERSTKTTIGSSRFNEASGLPDRDALEISNREPEEKKNWPHYYF